MTYQTNVHLKYKLGPAAGACVPSRPEFSRTTEAWWVGVHARPEGPPARPLGVTGTHLFHDPRPAAQEDIDFVQCVLNRFSPVRRKVCKSTDTPGTPPPVHHLFKLVSLVSVNVMDVERAAQIEFLEKTVPSPEFLGRAQLLAFRAGFTAFAIATAWRLTPASVLQLVDTWISS